MPGGLVTDVGFISVAGSFTYPLSCVPWLHGRYPFPRYYGRSDFLRLALRLSTEHEHHSCSGSEVHCLSHLRFLPFCLQSCDVRQRAFSFVSLCLFSTTWLVFSLNCLQLPLLQSLGLDSGLRSYLACSSVTPHRIEFTFWLIFEPFHYGLAVRFQLLSTVGFRRRSYFPLQAH